MPLQHFGSWFRTSLEAHDLQQYVDWAERSHWMAT